MSVALPEQTITVYRGESIIVPFTMSPVENITGWTLKFTVTKAVDKVEKMLGPLSMTIVSGLAGTFNVPLLDEQTDIKPGSYRWDVWRTDDGVEQEKATGPFVVLGNSRVPPIT